MQGVYPETDSIKPSRYPNYTNILFQTHQTIMKRLGKSVIL